MTLRATWERAAPPPERAVEPGGSPRWPSIVSWEEVLTFGLMLVALLSVVISVEGLRIPDVQVELRDLTANVVIARTRADAIGQVTFPDVTPGRYVVRATREGFADAESAPFDVHPGTTEQVLIEMRLTFVRESVEVILPANSPTASGSHRARPRCY